MDKPTKLSDVDMLTLQNLNLRQQNLRLEHELLMRDIVQRYGLTVGKDRVDDQGNIHWAPAVEEGKEE